MGTIKYIVLFICIINFLDAKSLEKVNLNNEELEFIKNNPVVRLGSGISFEPYIMKNDEGQTFGYDREIANIIEKRTGLKIEFELDVWSKVQEKAASGELDGLSTAIKTSKREELYNFPKSYLSMTPVVIINKSNSNSIFEKEDLKGKSVAIQKDNLVFEGLAKSLDGVKIVYYDTLHEVLDAVVKNKVDFTILDESIYYLANKLGVADFIKSSFLLGKSTDLHFVLTKNKPLLESIFNKALDSINGFERNEIKNKWFKIPDDIGLDLTIDEKNYLSSKNSIKICINPNIYPFEKLEKGKHIGMSADFFKLLENKISIPFELIETKNWTESLAFVKKRKCDLLSLAMQTKLRSEYLNFTEPYIRPPLVLATKMQFPFINDLQDLKENKIGIVNAHAFNEVLKSKYSNFKIVDVKNVQDGLKKVSNGDLDGFIGTLASITLEFQRNYFDELKIAGKFDEKWELSVAVRSDDQILFEIMNKLVNSVDMKSKQEIVNRYISVKYEKGIDYSLIYKTLFISLLVILLFVYWNSRIKNEKNKVLELNKKLKEKETQLIKANKELEKISSIDKLTNIYNRRKIDEVLNLELERSNRTGLSFSIAMFDIDFFKSVNDTYGHQVGDDVLVSISNLVKENIRKVDILGRWGGEEFIIICPHTNSEGMTKKAQMLRKKIEEYNFDVVGKKTASFGVATYIKGDDKESITKRVDDALYSAKETGRNKVVFGN